MLTRSMQVFDCRARTPARERGVVIFLALIMLVALTLGGLALFRVVDLGGLVAGNIGFQRSATRSADAGTEAAIAWLNSASEATLYGAASPPAYYYPAAMDDVPGPGHTWREYFATRTTNSLVEDGSGNTVSYFIQRLCDASGEPFSTLPSGGTVNCVRPPNSTNVGSSKGSGVVALQRTSSVYYRITVLSYGGSRTAAKSLIQTTVIK